jgi:hypothetical protein
MPDDELSGSALKSAIEGIFTDNERIRFMATKAKLLGKTPCN